jgi:hypothetical protein
MMQRFRLKASRNIGLSATVSDLALKVAGSCFSGLFHHLGIRPYRIGIKTRPLPPGMMTLMGSVGQTLYAGRMFCGV